MSDNAIRWAISDCLRSMLARCGDCSHWMKSRECPRERNADGMSRGPSCGAIVCDQFSAKDAAQEADRASKFDAAIRTLIAPTPEVKS